MRDRHRKVTSLATPTRVMLELASPPKPIRWARGALRDLRAFPKEVRIAVGRALQFAQAGDKHPAAKALKGFTGASVLEIVVDHDRATYRAVYTVRFKDVVYVLHTFQKKSKHAISTPRREIDLIRERLKWAEQRQENPKNS
jgi:phage-related protein